MKSNEAIIQSLRNELIVSCQALEDEPLHSPFIMGRLAIAAMEGGAQGIRANSVVDIKEIKTKVNAPIIGIIKEVYEHSDVFITPTKVEVDLLYKEGVDIIAMDATDRLRPDGKVITEAFPIIRREYPDQLFMADCSTYEEAKVASELGFDLIGTTLSGYTDATKDVTVPNLELIAKLVQTMDKPVIAEGGISTPEELTKAFELGVHAAVVGGAITRPQLITKKFTDSMKNKGLKGCE